MQTRLGRRVWQGVLLLALAGLGFVSCWVVWPLSASAQGGSYVSIGVGDTTMTITGETSPGAFVTIADSSQIIGTTSADGTGHFQMTFPAQRQDIHKPSVYSRDTDGRYTDTVLIPTSLYAHFDTAVDFFLPPTIATTVGQVVRGEGLPLGGQTVPAATVSLVLDHSGFAQVTAGGDGRWSYQWPTDGLALGSHTVYAVGSDSAGQTSFPTHGVGFRVVSGIPGLPLPTPPPPTFGPTPVQPPRSGSTPGPITVRVAPPPVLVPSTEAHLPVVVSGGNGAYRISIDWGDGRIEQIVLDGNTTDLTHSYEKPGQYTTKLHVNDSSGNYQTATTTVSVTSQLAAVNNSLQLSLVLLFGIFLLEQSLRVQERRESRRVLASAD
jgi:Bacterial Ig domain/PKD domain/Bacterial Ig-like domain